jgi:Helicase associated domain
MIEILSENEKAFSSEEKYPQTSFETMRTEQCNPTRNIDKDSGNPTLQNQEKVDKSNNSSPKSVLYTSLLPALKKDANNTIVEPHHCEKEVLDCARAMMTLSSDIGKEDTSHSIKGDIFLWKSIQDINFRQYYLQNMQHNQYPGLMMRTRQIHDGYHIQPHLRYSENFGNDRDLPAFISYQQLNSKAESQQGQRYHSGLQNQYEYHKTNPSCLAQLESQISFTKEKDLFRESFNQDFTPTLLSCNHEGNDRSKCVGTSKQDAKWMASFDRLKRFFEKNGHCQISRHYDVALYTWACNQRLFRHARGRYKKERIALLDSIDFQWELKKANTIKDTKHQDKSLTQEDIFKSDEAMETSSVEAGISLVAHSESTDETEVCSESERTPECCDRQANIMKLKDIETSKPFDRADETTSRLERDQERIVVENSGFKTLLANSSPHLDNKKSVHDLNWEINFEALRRFQVEHGHCNVQKEHNKVLYFWIQNQRTNLSHAVSGYKQDRVHALNTIGFDWRRKKRKRHSTNEWEEKRPR